MVADSGDRAGGRGRGRRGGGKVLGSGPGTSVRLPAHGRGPEVSVAERTVPWLRVAAAYSWRLILVGIVVYGVFTILGRFQLIAVALFLALVITSVLHPVADLLDRVMPRSLSVAIALIGSLLILLALLALVGNAVAGEWTNLVREFRGGIHRIELWLQKPPFRLSQSKLADLQRQVTDYFNKHRASLLSSAVSGLGRVVEIVTGGVLALFSSVFFLHSGGRLWRWVRDTFVPGPVQPTWDRAGHAAWRTFAGYTRGIIIVAATNAVLVGVALLLLRVPLALPLALLEFFAAFVPLVGSPVALAVATVVALAGRGPITAAAVLALIVVIGQLEGHVLHPVVMSWAVRLHPLVVAVSVIAGSIVAGVIGAIVAVPFISVVWSVLRTLRTPA